MAKAKKSVSTRTSPRKTTKPKASAKKKARTREAPAQLDALSAALAQLGALRGRFAALDPVTVAQLVAHHDDARCRSRGSNTRAKTTFRDAMVWARSLDGARAELDAAEVMLPARWFLDCLMLLGAALDGQQLKPDLQGALALADARSALRRSVDEARRRARAAAGSLAVPRTLVDEALSHDEGDDPELTAAVALCELLDQWVRHNPYNLPLGFHRVDAALVAKLKAEAATLSQRLGSKAAPAQLDRDSPEINLLEGRLQFAMRVLWDRLAEAREIGQTGLLLLVTPTLIRGLDLPSRKRARPTPA
ncbi:MAG: hypothetical protein JNK72_01645 [Myxococcales bacterium]|nr:hypothetical protein [Myxococcales bacterium]